MDLRFNRVGAVAASILLVVVALVGGSVLSDHLPGPTLPAEGTVRELATGNFDQLVVVLMENKNLDEVYGPAAYMTGLADLYSFSEGWASITNPSQPNYIAILGGSTFGVSSDGNHPNLNHPTMVDILENTSKTWKAFAEDASGSGCSLDPPAAKTTSRSYRTRRSRMTRRGARTYSRVRTTKSSVPSTRGRTSSGSRRTTATTCTAAPSRPEMRGSRVGCRICCWPWPAREPRSSSCSTKLTRVRQTST